MVDKVSDWSLSANGNTTVAGISIAEGCPYANMNDAAREIMAAIRQEFSDQALTVVAAAVTTISGASAFKPMSGNTTIDSFGTAVTGMYRELRVTGTPLIKSTVGVTPDGANYQAAADDLLRLRSLGAGSWHMTVSPKAAGYPIGKHMIPVLAEAMVPATTNGPLLEQTETSTNKVNLLALSFDGSTAESAWIKIPAWTSAQESRGITMEVDWMHSATATGSGVAFSLAVLAVSDGDGLDAAVGTAVTVTDSKLGTGVKHTTAESATVTPSGSWAAGDMLFCKLARVPSDAADLVTADAQVISARLFMYFDAATDTTP